MSKEELIQHYTKVKDKANRELKEFTDRYGIEDCCYTDIRILRRQHALGALEALEKITIEGES